MDSDPAFIDSDVYLRLGLIIDGKRLKKSPIVLSRLASSFERSVLLNDGKILVQSPDVKDSVTVFDGRSPPDITIAHYLDRIFKYSACSPSCFVIAHIYIHQFLQRTRSHLKPLNVHRLIITSVMLAAKVFDDRFVTTLVSSSIVSTKSEDIIASVPTFIDYVVEFLFTFSSQLLKIKFILVD